MHEQCQLIGEGIHPQECIRKRIKKTCKCGLYAMLSYVVYVVINKNYMTLATKVNTDISLLWLCHLPTQEGLICKP